MNKLNVLSAMRLGQGGSHHNLADAKKIRTANNLPKIQSLDSSMMGDILPKKKQSGSAKDPKVQQPQTSTPQKGLDGIEEGKVGEEDLSSDSEEDDLDKSNSDSSEDDDSSIDMDGDEEERLYAQILQDQDKARDLKEAKKKGEHLDDLVDKEMIELLNVCRRLHCPKIEAIADKFVTFGPNPNGQQKVLVLDMDETMLHARFIQNDEDEANDDGDFAFTLESENSGSADVAGERTDSLKVSIKMRPFLDMALDFLAKYYEIVVFTAGTQYYADAALDFIDPDRQIIKHRLYRQHCVNPCHGVYVKDLRIIRDRELKNIILVDNSIISFAF